MISKIYYIVALNSFPWNRIYFGVNDDRKKSKKILMKSKK